MSEIASAVEKERLRFEGDLDKWMKVIGAGITGFQPEAYAVMDHACEELVRARAEIERLREALGECEDYFDNRADADCDQDGFIPNKEMELLHVVRTALKGGA